MRLLTFPWTQARLTASSWACQVYSSTSQYPVFLDRSSRVYECMATSCYPGHSTHGKANGHKRPGFTNQQTVIITCNHHPKPNVHAAAATKRLCMHMQASKTVSLPWRRSRRPCELGYERPTNQQTTRHSAAHHGKSYSQRSQHQQQAPRCLDNFPCDQRGRQRRALGQNHAAAPQRRPRAREPFFSLECSVTAHKRLQ